LPRSGDNFLSCATADPIAPPTCAIGPSRPTDENPPALYPRAAEIDHLEKIRESVTQHVFGKEAVEQQYRRAAAEQDHDDEPAMPSAELNPECVPLELAKQPREKFDQFAKP
jgi:hypothetical protein